MQERDDSLLESVSTHRRRLGAALAFGSMGARRSVGSIVRRLLIGMVLAAIACAVCIGVGFVSSILIANAAAAAAATQSPTPTPDSTLTPSPTPGDN
ncbi:MAG: hypothetical protein ABIR17_03605 [Pseudolysinimonas sp.]|uniref:hypothetical protein n=1 Tax=Pseudolysinimonas sp. TaxID=2680009 RepID=UPI003266BDA7